MVVNPVFLFRNENGDYLVITVKAWDWSTQECSWMSISHIGRFPYVPTIDQIDDMLKFDSEEKALRKVAELYAAQLTK